MIKIMRMKIQIRKGIMIVHMRTGIKTITMRMTMRVSILMIIHMKMKNMIHKRRTKMKINLSWKIWIIKNTPKLRKMDKCTMDLI